MEEVKDGRSFPREELERYRFRAIELRKKGWKVNDIAECFNIHRTSVSHWFTKVNRYGIKSLKRSKAKGKRPTLDSKDRIRIISWLKNPATNYGFETPLWTCKRVQLLIKKKLNKSIHISNVWEWLRKWKLTSQIPKRSAHEKDEKAAEKWLKEEWPKIKAHVRRWQAMLYFQDESGVSLTPVLGKTWAPKGKTPIVKVTGKRGGLCVTSAISPAGRMVFRIEKDKERVNAGKHIEFLQQIMKHHPNRKIIVVEDNAKPHIAKKVGTFVEQNKNRFAIYRIPSYSPDLNPDEHVWAYLKANHLKSHQAQTTDELRRLVKRKMQSIQRKKELIHSFFMQSGVL